MVDNVKFLFLLIVLLVANGCVRYTYSVTNLTTDLEPKGIGTIAVASQDLRSYVVSGEYIPQNVGVIRGPFGNPLQMTTDSGRPIADEMGDVISESLMKRGFKTIPVTVAATESMEQVNQKLTDTAANRLIHFQIKQWRSDTFNNLRLEFRLNVTVMDETGNVIAEKENSGDLNLGWGAGFDPVGTTRKKIRKAFKEQLEALFNVPDIVNAL